MYLKRGGRGSDWISDKWWDAVNKAINFGFNTMPKQQYFSRTTLLRVPSCCQFMFNAATVDSFAEEEGKKGKLSTGRHEITVAVTNSRKLRKGQLFKTSVSWGPEIMRKVNGNLFEK